MRYESGSDGVVEGVAFRYGGGGDAGGCCSVQSTDALLSINTTVDVADAVISESDADGIWVGTGLGSIVDTTLEDNDGWGLRFNDSVACANWSVSNVQYAGNGVGELSCP